MKALGVPMIQVWILILGVFSLSTQASDFNHIKLNPGFKHYLKRPQLKSISKTVKPLSTPTVTEVPAQPEVPVSDLSDKIRSSLLGGGNAKGEFDSPFPADGSQSLLYEEIRSHLEAAHNEIGVREVTQLDFLNRSFNLGTENISGFSWQKPFGVVHVHADRQVTPNLFGSNWLIQDTFTFDIEATSFLQKANEAGITSMTDLEIGAFAGITFKRVYTYYHYANSYNEGLHADFSKLFLPFLKFNTNGISKMRHEEIIKREDNWTARAGGLITTPPYYGFSMTGGVLAQFAYQNIVSVQNNLDKNESEDMIRLSAKGKTTASLGINVALQADFLKILKLTILNYDLTYEYAQAKEITLGMSEAEWQNVVNNRSLGKELNTILHGYGKVQNLEPYVVGLNESDSSAFQQRGSLLIWGRLAKSKTEKIRVIKDETVKLFFKSYAQNMRVVQNIFSRVFSAVVYKIFKLPMGTQNAALYNRQVNIEYEATHPQSINPNIARVEGSEEFSFSVTQSYEASRTDRWVDKKFKNDVIRFIDSFTTLPKDYKGIIRSEQLRGPLLIESNLLVEKAGFDYLISSSENKVFGDIAKVCDSELVSQWMNERFRKENLYQMQEGAEYCVQNIGIEYKKFKSDYNHNSQRPSLSKFKKFLTKYYKQSSSLAEIASLFGKENTFIHGKINATTSMDTEFSTTFSSGQFRGLGVIDNYKRSVGSRQPASIVSE